jgi:hypothetical protein
MGILSKPPKPEVKRLPRGTFTVDAVGQIVSSTVPQSVSTALVQEIGHHVLSIFIGAREAQAGFGELVVQYASFKITAREMRGGAIIFLSPSAPQVVSRN